jgi:hypothetical protein
MVELNEEKIEKWSRANTEEAKALGRRLFENQAKPEKMRELPSLGEMQDKIQEWAIKNPSKARMLVLKLVSILAK